MDPELIYFHIVTDARNYAANDCYKKAFSLYLQAFFKNPRMKKRLEPEFRDILTKLNENLSITDEKAEIFQYLEIANKHFPGNVHLLNDIGKYLYKYGYFIEALCHFEKALRVDSSFIIIERNLNNTKRFLFPRCIFRSLNDKNKNEAYRRAIKKLITPGVDSVLNLDTGTGLLALYAAECRPTSIVACDSSKPLAKVSEAILRENQEHDIAVVSKPCGKLTCQDIRGPKTLLFTDRFDAGLFGDYVLQNLCRAWEELLADEATVLPGRAEYFVVAVGGEKLRQKFQLNERAKERLNISSMNVHITTCMDYSNEDINLYDDIDYLSEPVSLLKINFNDYKDIQSKLFRQEAYAVDLKALKSGTISTVIGWFNLYLTNDIMITNDPRSEKRIDAWPQAVFVDFTKRDVKKGDVIPVRFTTQYGRLGMLTDSSDIMRVTPEIVKFLNDDDFMDLLIKSMAANCVYLGQSVDITDTDILDLSPFPFYGFELMRRGARTLTCHASNKRDKLFLDTVFKRNYFPDHKYQILLEDAWEPNAFKDKKYHLIFCNIIEVTGDIDVIRRRMAHQFTQENLHKGGLLLPSNVAMFGVIMSSDILEKENRITDENVSGYYMSNHVNRYQISHTNADISMINLVELSDTFVVTPCLTHARGEVLKVPIVEDGVVSGVLCWYEVHLKDGVSVKNTQRPGSFSDCIVYLSTPPITVFKGDVVNVVRCVDPDGTLKVVVDTDV